jgi:hypothetical protein
MRLKSRMSYTAWVLVISMGLSTGVFADTYNFNFSKPSKSKKGPQIEVEEDEESAEEKPKESAKEKKTEETVASDRAPIVIHNNNSIAMPPTATPVEAPRVEPKPEPRAEETSSALSSTEATVAIAESSSPSAWRLGLLSAVSKDVGHNSGNKYNLLPPAPELSFGVSLAYSITRALALNTYASFGEYHGNQKLYGGAEIEFLPVRWQLSKWDPITFGILFGGSTLAAAPGNLGTLHAGLRLNINPIKELGITGALRGNAGYMSVEFGVTVRL